MPADELDEGAKVQARKACDDYDEFLEYTTLIGPGVALVPVGAPAPQLIGAGVALLGFLVRRKRKTARRVAEDPADPNFHLPARSRPIRLDLQWFGHQPPGREFARAARDLSSSEAELRAFITALERTAGAREAGDREEHGVRLGEAITHAQLAGRFLAESQTTMAELSGTLKGALPAGYTTPREPEEGETLTDLMSNDTAALLFRVGVRKWDVDTPVPRPLPRERWPSLREQYCAQLEEVGSANRELGRALTSWANEARSDGPDQAPPSGRVRW
jgi:hypothetical protein